MILDEILKKTKTALEKRKKDLPYDMLGRSLAASPFFPKNIHKALKKEDDEIKIIAEVKKAKSRRKTPIEQIINPMIFRKVKPLFLNKKGERIKSKAGPKE